MGLGLWSFRNGALNTDENYAITAVEVRFLSCVTVTEGNFINDMSSDVTAPLPLMIVRVRYSVMYEPTIIAEHFGEAEVSTFDKFRKF